MLTRYLLRPSALRSPHTYRLPPTISQLLKQDVGVNSTPTPTSTPTSTTTTADTPTTTPTTTVSGWIKSIRKQKNVSFAVISDGSSDQGLQAVILKKKGQSEDESVMRRLTNGAAVRLTGTLVASPGAGQTHELLVEEAQEDAIVVLGECDPETYPIQKKSLTNEYLRDNAHLRARTSHIAAMLRLRHTLTQRVGSFFSDQGFTSANTPILTGNDAEGAGESFRIASMDLSHPASSSSPSSSLQSQSPSQSISSTPPSSPPEPTQSTQQPQPTSDFFSRPAYLTVSHQLHLEALATALSRVYTLSPCFRAEPSLTRRHLAEFWMLEAEWAFTDSSSASPSSSPSLSSSSGANPGPSGDLREVCKFTEAMIRSVAGPLLSSPHPDPDIASLWHRKPSSPSSSSSDAAAQFSSLQASFAQPGWWATLTYTQAVSELQSAVQSKSVKFEYEVKWGKALQSEHEKWLAETLVGGPVFVTEYPKSLKPFYMRVNEHDPRTVACFDLLVPHLGELVGGSVREERWEVLHERMVDAGLIPPEGGALGEEANAYKWYEDLRKYGGAPHAGFGMGFERLVAWVGGIENVRECVPMPRWAGRLLL